MSWQEEVRAKEELDRLMRVRYGEQPRGKHRSSAESAEWSTIRTAELLQESEGKTVQDISLAKAIRVVYLTKAHLKKVYKPKNTIF